MNFKTLTISMIALSTLTFSCKKEGCTDPIAINYDEDAKKDDESCEYAPQKIGVDMTFNPTYGSNALALMQNYTDGSGNTIHFTRLDFYISSVDLIGPYSKGIHSSSDAFLFTMDNKTFNLSEFESEDVELNSITFNVGVPENLNTSNGSDAKDPSEYPSGHALAFHTPNMHWSWNSGYIFLAIEGKADTNGDGNVDTDFEYHIGMNSMLKVVNLSTSKSLVGGNNNLSLNIDLEEVISGVDCSTELITHTMDNMPLANKIMSNIPNAFTVN